MKQFELDPPEEGVNTIVAQFAAFKVDEVVAAVQASGDHEAHMDENYPDVGSHIRDKILTLARGETPADDFVEGGDGVAVEDVDENTLTVDLGGEDDYVAGDLIYFRGRRWVVGSRVDDTLVLKAF